MVLYTTNCSKCRILEAALKSKNIPYETCADVDKMVSMGFTSAPVLDTGDAILPYDAAMKYVMESE